MYSALRGEWTEEPLARVQTRLDGVVVWLKTCRCGLSALNNQCRPLHSLGLNREWHPLQPPETPASRTDQPLSKYLSFTARGLFHPLASQKRWNIHWLMFTLSLIQWAAVHERMFFSGRGEGLLRDTCKVNVVDVPYTLIYWSGVCWAALSSAKDELTQLESRFSFSLQGNNHKW